MRSYTVIYRRRKDSPISYVSGVLEKLPTQNYTAVEKAGFSLKDKVVKIPIVKGSHFRGRLRQYTAEKVLEKKSDWIDTLSDREKQKVFKTAVLCYLVGSVQENEEKGSYDVVKELEKADAFFKYFGYMVANLPARRSDLSIGFAVPVIENVTLSEELITKYKLSYVVPDEIEMRSVSITGNLTVEIPYPLVDVETFRVSGKLDKIEKIGSLLSLSTEEVKEIIQSYVGKSKKSSREKDKEDMTNILFAEVMAPSYDLVQKVVFLDDDEEMHRGILAGLKGLFTEEPFVGGRISAGYGLVDEVIILSQDGEEVSPEESDFDRFVSRIDLEKVINLISPAKKGQK